MQQKRKAVESAAPGLLWGTLLVAGSLASTEVREAWAVPAKGPHEQWGAEHFTFATPKRKEIILHSMWM